MKLFAILLVLASLSLTSCGSKSKNEILPSINTSQLTSDFTDINSYESNEMKTAGLVFKKSYELQNGLSTTTMTFDESKLNETSVGVLITTLEDYVKKVEALLSKYKEGFKDENGTVNELREGVKSDLNLKKDLCKKVITKLKESSKVVESQKENPAIKEMNLAVDDINNFESNEMKTAGLVFLIKDDKIQFDQTKLTSKTLTQAYVILLSNFISKAKAILNKYEKESTDANGNKAVLDSKIAAILHAKLDLSTSVME